MRILLVDNDEEFCHLLKEHLTEQFYTVDIAINGQEGWDFAEAGNYDLIVLDIMLPKLDGINLCRRLRAQNLQSVVLFLTGRGTSEDKIIGLDAGADDYLVKPVPILELEARIRALLRRQTTTVSPILEWGELHLNPNKSEITHGGVVLNLTPKEYALLELFMRNSQKIHSQTSIVNQLWSFEDEPPGLDTVRTLIKRLRQKLKAVGVEELIETLYGLGYRLNPALGKVPVTNNIYSQPINITIATKNQTKTELQTRLLIVDQDREFTEILVSEATRLGIQTAIAPNPKLALDAIGRVCPDIVLVDMSVSGSREDGLMLLEKLSGQTPAIPALVFVSNDRTIDRVAIARRKGRGFFQKPITSTQVLEAITDTLKPVKIQRSKVMVLDDDRLTLHLLKTLLEPWELEVITLSNPLIFWDELEDHKPDLLILDVQMPDIDGIELCQMLRNDLRWASLPIIFLTAQRDTQTIQQVFTVGADDYVSKPVVAAELLTRIFNRLERTRLLRSQAEIDPITNLPNYHRSSQDLERLLHLAKQHQQPFCLSVLALDNLMQLNRQHGHRFGDQMLRRLAYILGKELHSEDIIGRWNGTKFVVGMYGITRSEGVEWLAEVLELLPEMNFSPTDSQPVSITFSAGVAQYAADGTDIHTLYQAAELILEKAKELGGDRILPANWQPLPSNSLVVYDVILLHQESPFANSVIRALKSRGYHTRWLQDGKTALKFFAVNKPILHGRVILVEDNLPNANALDILKHFKRDKNARRSKIFWLSSQLTGVETPLALGCFDYVNIPCNISAFMHRLHQALES